MELKENTYEEAFPLFGNAYFGKPYTTRDGRKAIYQRVDDEFHHLFLSSCDFIVDNHGYLNCKEIPSGFDIVSEWAIDEGELDNKARTAYKHSAFDIHNGWEEAVYCTGYKEGFGEAMV